MARQINTTVVPSSRSSSSNASWLPSTSDPDFRNKLIGFSAAVLTGGILYSARALYKYYSPRKFTQYKLIYFNSRGVAEPIRFIMAIAGVEYEDHRFDATKTDQIDGQTRPAEFVLNKESYPYGQVPVLQIGGENGIVLAQSRAIERYLAKTFGFYGSNDLESQFIDSIVEHIRDMMLVYRKARETDTANGGTATTERDAFFVKTMPTGLRYLDRLASAHGKAADHSTLVGSSISLADIFLYYFLTFFDNQDAVGRASAPYVNIRSVRQAVSNHPAIQKWIAERPATEF